MSFFSGKSTPRNSLAFVVIRLRPTGEITADVHTRACLREFQQLQTWWRGKRKGPWTLNYDGPDGKPKSATFGYADIAAIDILKGVRR